MENVKLIVNGHVKIIDCDTNEILLDRQNAIHKENFNLAVASVMTGLVDPDGNAGFIYDMVFGNGGGMNNTDGNFVANSPRVTLQSDVLYNQTYQKLVHNMPEDNVDNNLSIVHEIDQIHTDVIVKCTLERGEPMGQLASTPAGDFPEGNTYAFDELGLRSQQGKLLTHLVFQPIGKAADRKIQVIYKLRITTDGD